MAGRTTTARSAGTIRRTEKNCEWAPSLRWVFPSADPRAAELTARRSAHRRACLPRAGASGIRDDRGVRAGFLDAVPAILHDPLQHARHGPGRRAPRNGHPKPREDPDLRRLRCGWNHLRGHPDEDHRAGRRRGGLAHSEPPEGWLWHAPRSRRAAAAAARRQPHRQRGYRNPRRGCGARRHPRSAST